MDMRYQYIADRKNRREDVPPLFWLAVLLVCVLLSSNVMAEPLGSRDFVKVIACESSWYEHKVGDGGKSFGLPQFKRSTFAMLSKKAMRDPEFVSDFRYIERKISRPVFRYPSHKLLLAQWAMANGYGEHWTCYRKLMARAK